MVQEAGESGRMLTIFDDDIEADVNVGSRGVKTVRTGKGVFVNKGGPPNQREDEMKRESHFYKEIKKTIQLFIPTYGLTPSEKELLEKIHKYYLEHPEEEQAMLADMEENRITATASIDAAASAEQVSYIDKILEAIRNVTSAEQHPEEETGGASSSTGTGVTKAQRKKKESASEGATQTSSSSRERTTVKGKVSAMIATAAETYLGNAWQQAANLTGDNSETKITNLPVILQGSHSKR